MATEVWVRNPDLCIKECLEVGVERIVFDKGLLVNKQIDPERFMQLYYGVHPYRVIVVGKSEQGAYEFTPETTMQFPNAIYPVWEYGDKIEVLEDLARTNPAPSQDHRVVLTDLPVANTGVGRRFYHTLKEIQAEYPETILHVHGLYSFRYMFGLGYRAADVEPRTHAHKGKVLLPNGQVVLFERAAEQPHWVSLLGFHPADLKIPRNRCMFNIKSALWAGDHFEENVRFKSKGFTHIDPDDPTHRITENRVIFTRRKKPVEGDMFLCNTCSLQTSCKYARVGAICVVPDAEPQPLAEFFNTRDSETIINGLGTLLAAQAHRFNMGHQAELEAANDEDAKTKLDPEVTRIGKALMDGGVKLAKLVDPTLRTSSVSVHQNIQQINAGTPQALIAQVVDELVKRGIPRDEITPEMIKGVLSQQDTRGAIEATAVEKRTA